MLPATVFSLIACPAKVMFRSLLHLILGFSILMAFALIPARLRAQQQEQQQEPLAKSDNTIRIGSEEVLLDIIVRDKKGRPIKDLKPEDIEIYEDDQKQRVGEVHARCLLGDEQRAIPLPTSAET